MPYWTNSKGTQSGKPFSQTEFDNAARIIKQWETEGQRIKGSIIANAFLIVEDYQHKTGESWRKCAQSTFDPTQDEITTPYFNDTVTSEDKSRAAQLRIQLDAENPMTKEEVDFLARTETRIQLQTEFETEHARDGQRGQGSQSRRGRSGRSERDVDSTNQN